jgi:hypothetical protein
MPQSSELEWQHFADMVRAWGLPGDERREQEAQEEFEAASLFYEQCGEISGEDELSEGWESEGESESP